MLSRVLLFTVLVPFVAGAHIDRASVHRRHDLVGKEANVATTLTKRQSYDNAKLTWYPVGLGACGQTNVPTDYIVALDSALYDVDSHCFAPITISYSGKTAQATIVDRCEGCPMGGLDLSAGLFQFFTDGDLGAPPLFGSWSYGTGGETTTTSSSSYTSSSSSADPPPPPTTSTYSAPPETSTSETPTSTSESLLASSSAEASSSVATSTSAAAAQTSAGPSAVASAVPFSVIESFNQAVIGMAGLIVAGVRAH